MGRLGTGLVVASFGVIAAAPAALPSDPAPRATVLEATVRFGRPGDPAATGRIRMEGDLLVGTGFAAFDPLGGGLGVTLGPASILDGALPEGARLRARTDGSWTLSAKRLYGGRGRLSLRMFPASGRYTLRASGFPAAALRDAGPEGVSVGFSAGATSGTDVVDFDLRSPRKWTYLRPPPVRHPPDTGDVDGGGSFLPPASWGIVTIAEGQNCGIHGFRFEVVRDQPAWQSLWITLGTGQPMPAVDFSTHMVVAVVLGDRSSGGYDVDITAITPSTVIGAPGTSQGSPPQGANATILETLPGLNPVTANLTQPFQCVRVTRVDGPVTYELAQRTR